MAEIIVIGMPISLPQEPVMVIEVREEQTTPIIRLLDMTLVETPQFFVENKKKRYQRRVNRY